MNELHPDDDPSAPPVLDPLHNIEALSDADLETALDAYLRIQFAAPADCGAASIARTRVQAVEAEIARRRLVAVDFETLNMARQ